MAPLSRRLSIRRRGLTLGLTALAAACGGTTSDPGLDEFEGTTAWASFSIPQMRADRAQQRVSFLTFLDERSFRMGLFHADASTDLGLSVHPLNAVYYVVEGTATISTETEDHPVRPGSILFVRGGVEHRIRQIRGDLEMVVVFRIERLHPDQDPEIFAAHVDDAARGRDPEGPAFNDIVRTATVNLGMYMLPKGFEDTAIVSHEVDEFKIIVNGAGRFDIGTGGFGGQPGSVAFIENDVAHRFRRISDALDVLVIWER